MNTKDQSDTVSPSRQWYAVSTKFLPVGLLMRVPVHTAEKELEAEDPPLVMICTTDRLASSHSSPSSGQVASLYGGGFGRIVTEECHLLRQNLGQMDGRERGRVCDCSASSLVAGLGDPLGSPDRLRLEPSEGSEPADDLGHVEPGRARLGPVSGKGEANLEHEGASRDDGEGEPGLVVRIFRQEGEAAAAEVQAQASFGRPTHSPRS